MSTAPKRGRGRRPAQLSVPWLKVEIEPDGHAALARYGDAATMDMADWLINLELRSLVARTGDAGLARFVRENPIIRRSVSFAFDMPPELACLSADARAILACRQPGGGVRPLRADEVRVVEQHMPAAMRESGRAIDDAFDPPLLGRFARIDMSLPDDVLVQEFKHYLAQQREQLARVAPDAPFARAIDDIEHRYDPKPATWARLHVLALLDVQAWLAETGTHTTPGAIARALGLDARDHQQAVEYAKTLTNDFALRGWLLSAARTAL